MIRKLKKYIKHPKNLILLFSSKGFFNFLSDKHFICFMYFVNMRKKLNLKNPQTFNEKLQWLKLNDRKDIYTTMVDKYEVKNYVSKIIGEEYIIPTLGVWDKFEDIDFKKLPNKFVLKCTHDSGSVFIIKDKSMIDYNQLNKKINKALKKNFYYLGREWPYKNVKPRIIAEPYLEDYKYDELRDYKLFVFNNKHALTLICSERSKKVKFTFFDNKGKFLDIHQCGAENDANVELPINYKKMIKLAEKLSKDTIQVRVDFYEINDKIYFGELTFFDSSGMGEYNPEEWDYKIGEMIKLPK